MPSSAATPVSPIPAVSFSSAPALEVRELGEGKYITFAQADAEVAALGPDWRLETPAELYALVNLQAKNQHGAYSIDESLKDDPYWTSEPTPWSSEGRFVVYFDDGFVHYGGRYGSALARAVRVSGQSLAL